MQCTEKSSMIASAFLAALIITLGAGCSRQDQSVSQTSEPSSPQITTNKPSAVSHPKIVEDLTGYTQIKAGQKAKDDIQKLNAERNKELNEATK